MTDFEFRANKARWLKVLLMEELPTPTIYLYGSVSKQGWIDQDYTMSFDDNSDYDFAIGYNATSTSHLDHPANGWTKKEEMSYQDSSTVGIYEKQLNGFKVQVSQRYDLDAFTRAWDSIPSSFYWKYINKRSPTAFPREDVKEYLDQLFRIAQGSKKSRYNSVYDNVREKVYGDRNPIAELLDEIPAPQPVRAERRPVAAINWVRPVMRREHVEPAFEEPVFDMNLLQERWDQLR